MVHDAQAVLMGYAMGAHTISAPRTASLFGACASELSSDCQTVACMQTPDRGRPESRDNVRGHTFSFTDVQFRIRVISDNTYYYVGIAL